MNYSEFSLYGMCPLYDQTVLVRCQMCHLIIKLPQLADHLLKLHGVKEDNDQSDTIEESTIASLSQTTTSAKLVNNKTATPTSNSKTLSTNKNNSLSNGQLCNNTNQTGANGKTITNQINVNHVNLANSSTAKLGPNNNNNNAGANKNGPQAQLDNDKKLKYVVEKIKSKLNNSNGTNNGGIGKTAMDGFLSSTGASDCVNGANGMLKRIAYLQDDQILSQGVASNSKISSHSQAPVTSTLTSPTQVNMTKNQANNQSANLSNAIKVDLQTSPPRTENKNPNNSKNVTSPPVTPNSKKKALNSKFMAVAKIYNPDKHCGVILNQADLGDPANGLVKLPNGTLVNRCLRSLTCKKHSVNLRRQVEGRSKPFNELFKEYRNEKLNTLTGSTTLSSSSSSSFSSSHNNNNNNETSPVATTITSPTANSSSSINTKASHSNPSPTTPLPNAAANMANGKIRKSKPTPPSISMSPLVEQHKHMPYSHLQPSQSQTQPQQSFFAEQPLMSAAGSNVTSMLNVQEPRLGVEDMKREKFDLEPMNKGTFNFDPQPLDSMGSLNLNNLASQIVKHHPRPSAVSSFNARTIDYGGGYTLWSRRQDNLRLLLTKTFLSQAASSFMSPSLASATATSSNCLNSFGALAHPSNYHNHFFHSQHQHPHQPQLQPHPSLQYQQQQQGHQQFLPVNECPVKSEPMPSQSTSFFPNGSSTNTADELKKSLKRSLSSGLKNLSNKVALTSTSDMTSGEQQPDALNNDVKSHHGKVKRKLISNAHSPSPPYSACSSTSSGSSSSNYVSTTSSSASSISNNQPSTAAFNNLLSNSKCFDYSK